MKLSNHAEPLHAVEMSKWYLINLNNVFPSVKVEIRLYECITRLYYMKVMDCGAVLYNPYDTHIEVAVAKGLIKNFETS